MVKRKLKDPFSDKIPFKADGSVPWERPKSTETHWPAGWDYGARKPKKGEPIIWKENKPFKAALKFDKVINKRSSVQFLMRNTETSATYYVSEDDFDDMMQNTTWIFGVCLGEWIFRSYRGYLSIVPASKASSFQQ